MGKVHFQYFWKCPNPMLLAFSIFSFSNIVIIGKKNMVSVLTHNISRLHIVVLLLNRWSLHHFLLLLVYPTFVVFKHFFKYSLNISSSVLNRWSVDHVHPTFLFLLKLCYRRYNFMTALKEGIFQIYSFVTEYFRFIFICFRIFQILNS